MRGARPLRGEVARDDRIEPQSRRLQPIYRKDLAVGRSPRAEDTLQQIVMRRNHVVLRDLCPLARPFVITEEEQAIAHDWTAKRAAELIPAQCRLREAIAFVEERVRASRVAAIESEEISVELIGAGWRDHAHGRRTASRIDSGDSRRDGEFA